MHRLARNMSTINVPPAKILSQNSYLVSGIISPSLALLSNSTAR